jgi:hypothetical protein
MTSVMMKGPSQGGRELIHNVGLLDAPEDEVANVEGDFLNVVIVIASKLLVVMSLSHDGSEPVLSSRLSRSTRCVCLASPSS